MCALYSYYLQVMATCFDYTTIVHAMQKQLVAVDFVADCALRIKEQA